ncbi:class I SAM-dependent methyltransferase [Jeongeupia wiesaeckerbachi]|uniref:class I SAM-dependent methyltransferase n=1 Tax=Jeongeupia wiesaeckerbachi TaxID=3051218 RepID=UPI003D8095FF
MIAVVRTALLQCIAFGVALAVQSLLPLSTAILIWAASLTAGALAAVCFRRWWMVLLHASMPPMCMLALVGDMPPWLWLVAAVLTWAIGAGAFRHQVPLFLSNRQALRQLEPLIPEGAHVLDLGAGTGTVLAWLARRRPDLTLAGVEMAWLPWCIGWLRLRRHAVVWRRADAFAIDLSAYDVVYAYLSPAPMSALWRKACAEMADGAVLISNSFGIEGVPPQKQYPVGDWKQSELLVWHPKSHLQQPPRP